MPGRATDERFLKQQARSFDWDGVRERIETASAALDKLGNRTGTQTLRDNELDFVVDEVLS